MALPPLSSLFWSVAIEPLAFLLCLGAHFLPVWLSDWVTSAAHVLGFDLTQAHSYQPHLQAPFEGYYTRITTSTGATILLIFSTVRNAPKDQKPNLLHFSYIPPKTETEKTLIFNLQPETIEFNGRNEETSLELELTAIEGKEEVGACKVYADGTVDYRMSLPVENGTILVDIQLRQCKPWGRGNSPIGQSPEGPLSALENLLPLHWFVRSVHSEAEIIIEKSIRLPSGEEDVEFLCQEQGNGHIEKNWGASFPTGWVWIQSLNPQYPPELTNGYDHTSNPTPPYVSLAGGSTLGIKAFLVGFESPVLSPTSTLTSINWTFRPVFTILLPLLYFGGYVSPFCKEEYDSTKGAYRFEVVDWTWSEGWRKLVLTCTGTPGLKSSANSNTNTSDYIELPCPMSTGHDNSFAKETFEASVLVKAYVWKKSGPRKLGKRQGEWNMLARQRYEKAALEWGGKYWGSRSVERKDTGIPWLNDHLGVKGGKRYDNEGLKAQ